MEKQQAKRHIRQRKDGRYQARYLSGMSADGKAKYRDVYGRTQEEVEERLEAVGVVGGRARVHGGVLRIEAPRDSFGRLIGDDTLTADLKALGFTYITLDLEGVRSGSMD